MGEKLFVSDIGGICDKEFQLGEVTINEMRKRYGLPPIDNGDMHFTRVQCGIEPKLGH